MCTHVLAPPLFITRAIGISIPTENQQHVHIKIIQKLFYEKHIHKDLGKLQRIMQDPRVMKSVVIS